ncbi:MAG: TSUP family transporter [Desulfobulbaceae bacterium]|uniref:Probable membrane transporter protein n=1 Tax=Candidatus Desulfatifera sulfidica TaxID=2841691 RepID=A0A8J6N6G5_9BACT|nr:TSUP family transporter [Candidatus Desulfatifera sulfidica]
MEIIVIASAALLASGLTLFSGFGLGTLLLPVVAIFFPVEVAVGVTALVHLANNLFKLALLGGKADRGVVVSFGLPAILAALLGAVLLGWLSGLPELAGYTLGTRDYAVMPIKLVVGLLILAFVVLELTPILSGVALDRRLLPLGGAVSGFFGGLSGHQGAFRSMFLLKAGLNKEQFVATGVVVAVLVDLTRLLVYGRGALVTGAAVDWSLVGVATVSAFAGAVIGRHLLHKITIRTIQLLVSALLVVVSLGLISGLV